jgi:hypothetical protein
LDYIKIDHGEIEWGGMDFIDPVQYRDQWRALVSTVYNFQFQQNARKFLSSCAIDGLSRSDQLHGVSYGSKNWFTNKREARNLESAQTRFLRPLIDRTRLGLEKA